MMSFMKIGILRLMQTISVFPKNLQSNLKFMMFLICSIDQNHDISSIGEEGLKRYVDPDYKSIEFAETLLCLYLGNVGLCMTNSDTKSEACTKLKVAILKVLQKFECICANVVDDLNLRLISKIIAVSNDCLQSTGKLKSSGLSFINWVTIIVIDHLPFCDSFLTNNA